MAEQTFPEYMRYPQQEFSSFAEMFAAGKEHRQLRDRFVAGDTAAVLEVLDQSLGYKRIARLPITGWLPVVEETDNFVRVQFPNGEYENWWKSKAILSYEFVGAE